MTEVDVVIVGAGPVGLYLAIDLAQRGVSVEVVDRAHEHGMHSRASIVWPRHLELLQTVGVADDLLDSGRAIEGVSFHSGRGELGRLRLSSIHEAPYPFGLAVSQAVTEEALSSRYEALVGPLRRDRELVGLVSDASGVDLTVRQGSETRQIRAKWLVGADGAHSTVRELANIDFTGPRGSFRFAICDAKIESTLSTRLIHYIYSNTAAVGIAPFTEETMRIAVAMPPGTTEPDHLFFQRALTGTTNLIVDVQEPEWSSAFDVRFRIASQFKKGRVLLAGDAAHILSPAGGQGMNTGLQDAANLGWKLAHVIQGVAQSNLLTSYDVERRYAAERATVLSKRLTRWAVPRGSIQRQKRDAEIFMSTRNPRRPNLVDIIAQLDTKYEIPNTSRRRSIVGTRFPSFAGKAPRRAPWSSWPTHDSNGYTLFVWPGSKPPLGWRDDLETLTQRSAHMVRDLTRTASSTTRLQLKRQPRYFLVRPDGHVSAEGTFSQVDEIPSKLLAAQLNPIP